MDVTSSRPFEHRDAKGPTQRRRAGSTRKLQLNQIHLSQAPKLSLRFRRIHRSGLVFVRTEAERVVERSQFKLCDDPSANQTLEETKSKKIPLKRPSGPSRIRVYGCHVSHSLVVFVRTEAERVVERSQFKLCDDPSANQTLEETKSKKIPLKRPSGPSRIRVYGCHVSHSLVSSHWPRSLVHKVEFTYTSSSVPVTLFSVSTMCDIPEHMSQTLARTCFPPALQCSSQERIDPQNLVICLRKNPNVCKFVQRLCETNGA
ncbi:hypothetical protein F2P81_013332 [Scophthalmus maximus]|uniref:Uncharacterized protein n=1 Tax=Scophthalmus maximus TaxID=52904 RepID=A0A6A4SWV6_SCOMX|nr:hypothetical protein F2P81_013332 [Scophthalmus maximus]